jgi:uncharacterized protein YgiM (DUF1202 family)
MVGLGYPQSPSASGAAPFWVYALLVLVLLGGGAAVCWVIADDWGLTGSHLHDAGITLAVAKRETVEVVVATTTLRVRAQASADSEQVATVQAGTRLPVLDRERSWIKVRTPSGDVGYVYAPLISRETE